MLRGLATLQLLLSAQSFRTNVIEADKTAVVCPLMEHLTSVLRTIRCSGRGTRHGWIAYSKSVLLSAVQPHQTRH